ASVTFIFVSQRLAEKKGGSRSLLEDLVCEALRKRLSNPPSTKKATAVKRATVVKKGFSGEVCGQLARILHFAKPG
ncbi:MAG: hypothetical protein LH618_18670, partial [Saprospiraceae bacterium]|nr:hypothetical protein [Saprospiraceae bacterium]